MELAYKLADRLIGFNRTQQPDQQAPAQAPKNGAHASASISAPGNGVLSARPGDASQASEALTSQADSPATALESLVEIIIASASNRSGNAGTSLHAEQPAVPAVGPSSQLNDPSHGFEPAIYIPS